MPQEFMLPTEFPLDAVRRLTTGLVSGSIDLPRNVKDGIHVLSYLACATIGDPDRPVAFGSADEYRAELEDLYYAISGESADGFNRARLTDWALDTLIKRILESLMRLLQEWIDKP